MGTIAVRVDNSVEKEIARLMKREGYDKSSAVRKLLERGIEQWRLENALEELKEGMITLSRAAEMAGVSIYEMVRIVKEKKIDYISISAHDLEKELGLLEGD